MANRRSDKLCVSIRVCLNNDINKAIENFKADRFIKGEELKKYEAAEKFIEKIYELAKPLMK